MIDRFDSTEREKEKTKLLFMNSIFAFKCEYRIHAIESMEREKKTTGSIRLDSCATINEREKKIFFSI